MPSFTWSQLVAAGATFLPLDGWQYEYLPFPAMVEFFQRATAVGVVATITSGSDTLQEESPVQAGGTAGVTPNRLNTEPISDVAAAGDRLKARYRNTSGAGVTVDGMCIVTAMRGRR